VSDVVVTTCPRVQVIIEVERESESVCIVGHQAILRVLYAFFMQVNRHEVRTPF
jgi:broad specificity phosphatase PhoE